MKEEKFVPRFFVEQLAISPSNPAFAKELLEAIGAKQWHDDQVRAKGKVFESEGENVANLSFNYELGSPTGQLEFEILEYTEGNNWLIERRRPESSAVSHLGMHCTEEELAGWREFFQERHIGVAQEVQTQSHTNPVIAGKRSYTYVIFDTHEILGVDLKFIVRKFINQGTE